MSLDLAAEREYVRAILENLGKGQAYGYIPAKTGLPAFLVLPDSPYLTNGQGVGKARIHLRVVYISKSGANDAETSEVDEAVSAAVSAFLAAPVSISIDGASSPYSLSVNGGAYLAEDLQISFTIDL